MARFAIATTIAPRSSRTAAWSSATETVGAIHAWRSPPPIAARRRRRTSGSMVPP